MQLLGCTESRRFSPPMHPHWHLPSRFEADASQDDGEGVEWRDVSCYETGDASLVVHRNADDGSVYSLSHAPTAGDTHGGDRVAGSADRADQPTGPDDGLGGAGRR